MAGAGADPDMKAMAEEEMQTLRERLPDLEMRVKMSLLPKDADDERNAILEVRAGTGGDEAALFAGELFRMYQRYAALQGLEVRADLDLSETGLGGYKEAIASITGRGVFARLKFESGVHRVQRVPATEGERPHPHLGRDRRGAARGRGSRHHRSTTRICASTSSARAARAANRSTPPTARCGSPISRPGWSSSSRTRNRSTRTRPRR